MRIHRKTEKSDIDHEKQLLTGLIMSDTFVAKLLPVYDKKYFKSDLVVKVADWIFEYYEQYGKAPKGMIQNVYNSNKDMLSDVDRDWIDIFLNALAGEYEKQGFNEAYLHAKTMKYFKKRKMLVETKEVQRLLDIGKVDEAEQVLLTSARLPDSIEDLGIDPFNTEHIKKLFKIEEDRAKLYLGIEAVDRIAGPTKTGWLAVFLAPMKRGKTFALIHVLGQAVLSGFNVVFISLETEEIDNAIRMWMNLGSISSEDGELKFPYYEESSHADKEEQSIEYELITRPTMSQVEVLRGTALYRNNKTPFGAARVKSFPMGTGGVSEIKKYLDALEIYEHFTPHVIIVDYIGAMKPPVNLSGRDTEYNHNSIQLKALAQERKAIMYSAHQASAETLEKLSVRAYDTSQDKRVLANVDIMFGLNQFGDEKGNLVMRISVLAHRHRRVIYGRQAQVLQQLGAGQFALDSRLINTPEPKDLKKDSKYKNEEDNEEQSS